MFQYCSAILCSFSASADAVLRELADQVGFGRIVSYEAPWPNTQIAFFLIHDSVADEEKKNIVAAVRGNRMFRFSPMIVIGDEARPSHLSAPEYRQAGFDDLIVPASGNIDFTRTLLDSLLKEEQTYYATPIYFGPDRRQWERRETRAGVRLQPTATHELYRFRRDPLTGVRVTQHLVVESVDIAPSEPFIVERQPAALPVKRRY